MRDFVYRLVEVALSWPTVVMTVAVAGYAVALRGLGVVGEEGGFAESMESFLSDGTLRAFILCPIWLLACCIWVISGNGFEALVRFGSERAWFAFQLRRSLAEAVLVVIPVVGGALVFAASANYESATPSSGFSWLRVAGQLALVYLALLAARSLVAFVYVRARRRLWVGIVASLIWLAGAVSATGTPLNSVFGAFSWITWTAPALSAEVFDRTWIGLFFLGATAVLPYWIIAIRECGLRAWWRARSGAGFVLGAMAIVAAQYAVLTVLAEFLSPVAWSSAVFVLFQGTEPDQVGVPLAPFFLSLIIYLGPAFFMIGRLHEELGHWMPLIIIRSGSQLTWVVQFLRRWVVAAVLTLVGALLTATAAWLLLSDADRISEGPSNFLLLAVVRYGVIGVLQVVLYCSLAFFAVWLVGASSAGLGMLVAFGAAGIANPLIGGWAPAYLNSLSRTASGPEGLVRDATTLSVWLLVTIVVIVGTARVRDFRSKERRSYASN